MSCKFAEKFSDWENLLTVRSASKNYVGKDIYRMVDYPHGICLLINNVNFDLKSLQTRDYSREDAKSLKHVFVQLGFIVIALENLTGAKISDSINSMLQKPELASHEAFILIILSHGNNEGVYGIDGKLVYFEDIKRMLSNQNAKMLVNKPKLAFIQACRGDNVDEGVDDESAVPATFSRWNNSVSNRENVDISDVIISYSTVDSYVSYCNQAGGSWYCYALCRVLCQHAANTEITDILRLVDSYVSERETLSLREEENGRKQTTHFEKIAFRYKFYFNPI